jgi:hypothetical protein
VAVERFPVEATHILMFARAIGEPDTAYADADDGVVAPPTFVVAGSQFDPDNPLRPKPPEPWFGSGREPSGVQREGSGVLHAEQHFEYHAPLRAGAVLTAQTRPGETWERQSKRAGTLHFSETITEYRDAGSRELVVTARAVVVKTERPVSQGG